MYAVILAGGGGTRLHPLSRASAPSRSCRCSASGRSCRRRSTGCAGLTDDITVVTDRRYERLVRDQAPGRRRSCSSRSGRNTAAAIALAALAIDRPARRGHGRRCPPTRPIERRDGLPRRPADRRRAPRDRRVRHRRPARDARHRRSTGRRPSTATSSPTSPAARTIDGLRAYPLQRLRGEAEARPGRGAARARTGVAWNAGIFLWRRRAIRRRARALHRPAPVARADDRHARRCSSSAYEAIQKPVSIDYAVMEGAAQSGQVVMASMDVGWSDLGSWSALLAALGATRHGRRRPGRRDGRGRRTTTSSSGGSAGGSGSSRHPSAVA